VSWGNRFLNFLQPRRLSRDVRDELELHLAARQEDNEAAGMPPPEAKADASHRLGNRALHGDRMRDANVVGWLENVRQDVLYSLRRFRRKPGVLLVAMLSLALGIGANSTIFSALESALWKPLPVAEPERLVTFGVTRIQGPEETDVPAPFALQLRDSGIFAGVVATSADGLSFSYDGPAERIIGEFVSPDYFNVVGVRLCSAGDFPSNGRPKLYSRTAFGKAASPETPPSLAERFVSTHIRSQS
jgi:hypothetical protein